jgi:hypothetical protein
MWGTTYSATNSLAISVARLRLHRPTVAACFVVFGKIAASHFWSFATQSGLERNELIKVTLDNAASSAVTLTG